MYQTYYSLKQDPFRLSPDPAFLYMTVQHREAFSGLVYSICTRPGLTVLEGEAGTGKTTLLYTLMGLLETRGFVSAMCTNPMLTREEFYDFLLARFNVECSSTLKSRQLIALQDALARKREEGHAAILIVDEAQRLSPELLEEIRLLLNMETPQEKLLELILAGQPELGEMLRRPELRQLKQRVSTFCKLQPLNLQQVRDYINYRIAQAGLPNQTLFPDAAIRYIHAYTQGIPRLVNNVCESALQTGFSMQSPTITVEIVEEVARDLDLRLSSYVLDRGKVNGVPNAGAVPATNGKPAAPAPVRTANRALVPAAVGTAVEQPLRIPMESYGSRRSLSLFERLRSRWW